MARRITRKHLKENEFVSVMDTLIHWFTENWRPIAAAVSAVSVVALIWWGVSSWTGAKTEKASYSLSLAVSAYQTARAESGDLSEARTQLEEVAAKFGRSDQADMARIYIAQLDIAAGDLDAARETLVQLVGRHRSDAIGRIASLDLIHLRVASGQGAEVAKELEAMVVGKDTRLPRDVALFELGEVFITEQDTEQAREYFQKLVDEFPESPYLAQARQRLAEIG